MPKSLVITPGSAAELRYGDRVLWSSARDPYFKKEFGDEVSEDQLEDVLEYLIQCGQITDEEASGVECKAETLDGDDPSYIEEEDDPDPEPDEDEDDGDFDDEDDDDLDSERD